jgi:hypothetical protein
MRRNHSPSRTADTAIFHYPKHQERTDMMNAELRADMVGVREVLNQAMIGQALPADFTQAVALMDRALRSLCPHGRVTWNSRADENGDILTTCEHCDLSWHEYPDPPAGRTRR